VESILVLEGKQKQDELNLITQDAQGFQSKKCRVVGVRKTTMALAEVDSQPRPPQ
jgi:hypothetical protein